MTDVNASIASTSIKRYVEATGLPSISRVAMDLPKNTPMHRRTRLRLDDFLPYLINRVGVALVVRFGEQALARQQVTIDMWRVLVALSDNGRQRQVDLAAMTSIEASIMSRLVTRLARRGLVDRSRSRTNGREVVVELTCSGKLLVDQLIPVALSVETSAIGAMGSRDLARIKEQLRRMYANLMQRPKSRA
jgi:DNA-binding MarR family transcriptional regulator